MRRAGRWTDTAQAAIGAAKATPVSRRRRRPRHARRRARTEPPGDEPERERTRRDAEGDEEQVAQVELGGCERGGECGAVGSAPPSRHRDGAGRLDVRGLHHRRGQQAGRQEGDVGDPVQVRALVPVDDRAEPGSERGQKQRRIDDADHDGPSPGPAVAKQPVPGLGEHSLDAHAATRPGSDRSASGRRPRGWSAERAS